MDASYSGHEIKINGKTFLRCKRSIKVSTCFTSGVKKLQAHDIIYITTTYPHTQVDMLADVSFFGLVQWTNDARDISDEL